MRVVDAIATHRSLKRAAAALGLIQPALTKALQELEELLGTRLFDRQPRGTQPNAMGEAVAASARRMLAAAQRLQDEFDRLGIAAGAAILRTSSISLIRELLLTSDAVTIIPQHLLAGDLARGTVRPPEEWRECFSLEEAVRTAPPGQDTTRRGPAGRG
jgi:DNA-binding transcriptional LysR family regulator